jgi:hypothetical protein
MSTQLDDSKESGADDSKTLLESARPEISVKPVVETDKGPSDPVVAASPEPKKKIPRTKKEQQGSLKVILKYLKDEAFQFVVGMAYLFLGQAADFAVPLFIGFVLTAIEKGEFEKIGPICW